MDAIRTAQEERDIKTANRTNPLDEELIKTKGLLKAPLRSDCKDPSKRESREIADAIAELEEERQAKEDKIRKETAEYKKQDAQKKQDSGSIDVKKNDTAAVNAANDNVDSALVNDVKSKNIERDLAVTESQTNEKQGCSINEETTVSHEQALTKEGDNSPSEVDRLRTDEEKADICDEGRNKTDSLTDFEGRNKSLSDLDLIQTTSGILGINYEVDHTNSSQQNEATGASELSAEFTFEAASPGAVSNIESSKNSISPKNVDTNQTKSATGNKSSRKRLSTSISGSDSETKQDDNDTAEFDIQEVFGAKQLKHVERPSTSNQTLNGFDSAASGEDDEVYVTKTLPELAQVFEPGDLKPKRHSRRNDGSRSPNPGKSNNKEA